MQQVIIDNDMGVDDAYALVLALMSDALSIIGITTVFGNVNVEQASQNVLHLLKLLERTEIPVFTGSAKAIIPKLDTNTGSPLSPEYPGKLVHGPKGFGNYEIPRTQKGAQNNAVQWLARQAAASTEPIGLVALGPLTNVALATLIEPRFVEKVDRIIFMGGVTDGPGNVRPLATANIWNDPEAALIVFHAGFKEIVMVGQDVTRYARVTEERKNQLEEIGTTASRFLLDISDTYDKMYSKFEPNSPGYPLHDMLAVAYLIDPGAFKTEKLHITVETQGHSTRGQTVADKRQTSSMVKQMNLCVEVDVERVFQMFFNRLSRVYPDGS